MIRTTVITAADALEDEFGVFTNANASITGPVNVLDNKVNVYWDSFGVFVRSVCRGQHGQRRYPICRVTIANNVINATVPEGRSMSITPQQHPPSIAL